MNRFRALALLLVATLALTACSTGSSASPSSVASHAAASSSSASPMASMPPAEHDTIRFGLSAADPAHFTLQLAFYAGMFEKYGLKAQGTLFDGPDAALQALLGGQVDVLSASVTQTVGSLTTPTPAEDIAVVTGASRAPDATPTPTAAPTLDAGASPGASATPAPTFDVPGVNVMLLRSYAARNPNTTLRVAAAVLEAMQLPTSDLPTVVRAYASWRHLSEEEAQATWGAYLGSGMLLRGLRPPPLLYEQARDALAAANPAVQEVDLARAFDPQFLSRLEAMGLYDALQIPKG